MRRIKNCREEENRKTTTYENHKICRSTASRPLRFRQARHFQRPCPSSHLHEHPTPSGPVPLLFICRLLPFAPSSLTLTLGVHRRVRCLLLHASSNATLYKPIDGPPKSPLPTLALQRPYNAIWGHSSVRCPLGSLPHRVQGHLGTTSLSLSISARPPSCIVTLHALFSLQVFQSKNKVSFVSFGFSALAPSPPLLTPLVLSRTNLALFWMLHEPMGLHRPARSYTNNDMEKGNINETKKVQGRTTSFSWPCRACLVLGILFFESTASPLRPFATPRRHAFFSQTTRGEGAPGLLFPAL